MIIDAHEERVMHPEKEGGQKPPLPKVIGQPQLPLML